MASDIRRSFAALTGLRAFAALWVVFFHFRHGFVLLMPEIKPLFLFFEIGYLGVDLFFVLSGFIISYVYLGKKLQDNLWLLIEFLYLRLARIYPVHLLTLGALFIVSIVVAPMIQKNDFLFNHSPQHTAIDLLRNVFLVQALSDHLSWNIPAWSVSAEWFAYITFPLIALIVVRATTLKYAALGVFVSFGLMLAALDATGLQNHIARVYGEFVAGCFLYQVYRTSSTTAPWAALSLISCLVLACACLLPQVGGEPIWLAPIFALLILSLAHSQTGLSKILASRPCVFWGEASYSLYMTHGLTFMVLAKVLPIESLVGSSLVIRVGAFVFYVVSLLAAGAVVYLWFETPTRTMMRRILPVRAKSAAQSKMALEA